MSKLRTALVVGVVLVGSCGAAGGLVLVHRVAPEATRSLLAVDVGMLLALGVAVWVLLGPTVRRLDELVEALRALARGERYTRIDAAHFAGLADVARAVNEVAASLCENDDPNLGPVQRRPRENPAEANRARPPSSDAPRPSTHTTTGTPAPPRAHRGHVEETSEHPELGPVRVRPRSEARTPKDEQPEKAPMIDGEGVSEPRPRRASAAEASAPQPPPRGEPDTAPSAPPTAMESNDTIIEQRAASTSSADGAADPQAAEGAGAAGQGSATDGVVHAPADAPAAADEGEGPIVPTRAELELLFSEFVREKRAAGSDDGVDVDFDAFAETVRGECQRLLAEHACRGVRFEVAVAEGEVSLRPRLMR